MNKLVNTVIERVVFLNEKTTEAVGESLLGVETDGKHARICWDSLVIWDSWDDVDGFHQSGVIYPDVPQATEEDVIESINVVLLEKIEDFIAFGRVLKRAVRKRGPK